MPGGVGTALRFFLLGLGVGLLVAPRSGRESRQRLLCAAYSLLGRPVEAAAECERLRAVEHQISTIE